VCATLPQPNITKINKTPYFGSSGSFKVIDADSTKKLITSACCDRAHAHAYCNLFHERLAKSGKITTLTGVLLLTPLCAGFFECRKSILGLFKSTFNAENFVCNLSLSMSIDFSAIHS